jgi:hypothetical protein
MNIQAPLEHAQSPLFMAINNPVLHQFISYLAATKTEQETNDSNKHIKIELTREFISEVREAFRQVILDGEKHLHVLAHLLSCVLMEGDFELHSNVIGVLPGGGDRPFLIRERINGEKLFSSTDIDLGNRMLDEFRYNMNGEWISLELSANFVEYIPVGRPSTGVNRITSRVKAEEELCNKVTDELFGLDELVSRDKHLRRYSKYVKDIFGIKIVCEDDITCFQLLDKLENVSFSSLDREKLAPSFGLPMGLAYESAGIGLQIIETKNYLTCEPEKLKKTGWKALKSVARWHDRLFEIQIQPLSNYYLELDHMAGPSHSSFKISRDTLRDEISKRIPLYGFYRDLLKMIFMETNVSFENEHASVIIT